MPWYLKMRYVCMVFLAARKTMEYKKPKKNPLSLVMDFASTAYATVSTHAGIS
jgi:hypothetical protein